MKILLVAQSAGVGGVETSLTNLVNYLVSEGHGVSIVFWRGVGPVRDKLPPNVRVLDVQTGFAGGVYRTSGVKDVLRSPRMLQRVTGLGFILVRKVLQSIRRPWILLKRIPEHFDVAIAFRHQGYSPSYVADMVDASQKVMWYHHGDYSPGSLGADFDGSRFGKMDTIVAVSEVARAVIGRSFPDLAPKVRVIPNILNEVEIVEAACEPVNVFWDSKALTLVTVSRLSSKKGVDLALRTAEVLHSRGVRFIWLVIGDGTERKKLEDDAIAAGLQDCFRFLGELTNPFPYVALADIYVQTSRVEADPLTIREALILNKPMVVSNIPPVRRAVEDGRLGLLSDLQPTDFADAIELLAGDDRLRVAYSNACRSRSSPNEVAVRAISDLLTVDFR